MKNITFVGDTLEDLSKKIKIELDKPVIVFTEYGKGTFSNVYGYKKVQRISIDWAHPHYVAEVVYSIEPKPL